MFPVILRKLHRLRHRHSQIYEVRCLLYLEPNNASDKFEFQQSISNKSKNLVFKEESDILSWRTNEKACGISLFRVFQISHWFLNLQSISLIIWFLFGPKVGCLSVNYLGEFYHNRNRLFLLIKGEELVILEYLHQRCFASLRSLCEACRAFYSKSLVIILFHVRKLIIMVARLRQKAVERKQQKCTDFWLSFSMKH